MKSFIDILRPELDKDTIDLETLRNSITTKPVNKGEVLQRKGEQALKVFYVRKGLLRSYAIDYKGKEHVFMFAPEGWIVADSVSPESPGELFIDAIEDSIVEVVAKTSVPLVTNKQRTTSLIKRISVLQNRVIMLMSASAIERYEHFLNTYPDITQRVPQRMIASYLGITPEALSKVKNEKVRE